MKFSTYFILVAFVCCSVNGFSNQIATSQSGSVLLARTISEAFISRLQKDLQNRPYLSQDTKATLIPPPADPAYLGPVDIPLNIPIPDLLTIYGFLNLTTAAEVRGLGNLTDDFNLNLIQLTVTWDVGIPSVKIAGKYAMDCILDIGSMHNVTGGGDFTGSVDTVFLKLDVKLAVLPHLSLSSFDLDLGFTNLQLNGGTANVDEQVIDWTSVSKNTQTYFDTIWTSEARPLIIEMVRCSVNHAISSCTLPDLINGGGADCLIIELDPKCFGFEDPSSTTTAESTTVKLESTTGTGALSIIPSSCITLLAILAANFVV